ncbi:MAG: type II secretion system GspH family protein [Phycisphaerales bacterium]|nr:type II secretion system GspH family protein [Phycisphaerales bacterium]
MIGRLQHCRVARGFTMVELIAVIAIVGLLLAILMPTVTAARRAAYRVVSAGNMRTLGQGIIMWSGGNDSRIPPSRVLEEDPLDLSELMRAYQPEKFGAHEDRPGGFENASITPGERYLAYLEEEQFHFGWDGLGHLFRGHFIAESSVFYSPAHWGDHPYDRYAEDWMHPDSGHLPEVTIYTNYHYCGHLDEFGREITLRRNPDRALIVDGLRSRTDMSHRNGLNMLWADNSVHWKANSNLFRHLQLVPRGEDEQPKQKQNEIIRSVFNGTLQEQLKRYDDDGIVLQH